MTKRKSLEIVSGEQPDVKLPFLRLHTLYSISWLAVTKTGGKDIIESIIKEASLAINADVLALALVDDITGRLKFESVLSKSTENGSITDKMVFSWFESDEYLLSLGEEVVKSGKPYIQKGIKTDLKSISAKNEMHPLHKSKCIIIPLGLEDEDKIGVIVAIESIKEIYEKKSVLMSDEFGLSHLKHFDEDDFDFLRAVAGLLTIAIRNTKLSEIQQITDYELEVRIKQLEEYSKALKDINSRVKKTNIELRQQIDRLHTVYEVGLILNSSLDLDNVVNNALHKICELMQATKGSLMLLNNNTKELEVKASYGRDDDRKIVVQPKIKLGEGIAGLVAETGEAYVVNDVENDPRFVKPSVGNWRGCKRLVCVPLNIKDRTIGVMNMEDKITDEPFTDEEVKFLITLGTISAIAIENARLYNEVREKERLDNELYIANQIQMKLLPKDIPDVPGLDLSAILKPAKEVGGDYYDFVSYPNKGLSIIIGDVSGKGIPAGLVMVMARTMIRSLLLKSPFSSTSKAFNYNMYPSRTLCEMNRVLKPDMYGKFMTLLLMNWFPDENKFIYSSAGHEQIIIYRDKTGECEVIKSGGIAIGIMQDISPIMSEKEIVLNKDDVMLLYTDGVIDAVSEDDKVLGFDGLLSIFKKCCLNKSNKKAGNILNEILTDIKTFVGKNEQYDDITMVVVKKE